MWQRESLRIETAEPSDVTIDVYNGLLVDPDTGLPVSCQAGQHARAMAAHRRLQPRRRPTKPIARCCDVDCPSGAASIAVEDVLAAGQVYVRDLGLLVSRADVPSGLAAYRQEIAGEQTILARSAKCPTSPSIRRCAHFGGRNRTTDRPCSRWPATTRNSSSSATGRFEWSAHVAAPFPAHRSNCATRFRHRGHRHNRAAFADSDRPAIAHCGQDVSKGLGLHANADLNVLLDGRYESFEAEVGVLPSNQPGGSVVFQIDVDGQRSTTVVWCDRAKHRGAFASRWRVPGSWPCV